MVAPAPAHPLLEPLQRSFALADQERVARAFAMADAAHAHQVRKSGEPYVLHCLETAGLLAELHMDPPVIMAGLLHDAVEDTTLTLDEIRAELGTDVAKLVDGVTRLSQISVATGSRKRYLGHIEAESLRKMFLAISEDVRIVFIKLADRLHNMRTLHALPRPKQIAIARETRELFAPIANRLGIWQFKWELEDLCLRFLEPEVYCSLVERLAEGREEREGFLAEVINNLHRALADEGVQAEISGRSKHLYSIYKKMQKKERDLDQIFDVRAVRVIVANRAECYHALGIAHSLWRPVPQEFDDYIANPKQNHYQSLHTAVYGPGGKAVEIQIRDQEMHRFAELGVAAHWRYKEGGSTRDRYLEQQVQFVRQLLEVRNENAHSDAETFMDQVQEEVLPDRVFVFTPKGEVRELPVGATPVDFAYYIHTDIGNRCRGAKVNGQIVPLSYTLKYGDRVEIITAKKGTPSRDWLNPYLGYVTTSRAQAKIRNWFRKQDRDENIRQGRELLEKELRRMGLPFAALERLAHQAKVERLDDFLERIGAGDISPHNIAVKEFEARQEEERKQRETGGVEQEVAALRGTLGQPPAPGEPLAVHVRGVGDLMTRVAGCCNPMVGEDIVGFTTRGHGISVHRRTCPNILNKVESEPGRLVDVEWGSSPSALFDVPVRIQAMDRDGLLRDILDVVANEKVNMRAVNATTNRRNNSATITGTMEVGNAEQLSRILARISRLQNVVEAHRAVNV